MNILKLGKFLIISMLIISKINCLNRTNPNEDDNMPVRYTIRRLLEIRDQLQIRRPLNMPNIPGITRRINADEDNMLNRNE